MRSFFTSLTAVSFLSLTSHVSGIATPRACTGTISSLSDVTAAVACTTVNINPFTVPGGSALTLPLLTGTTVNLLGDVLFGNLSWAGPLFTISGTNIVFNGNGHKFDGGGPFYWDGLGGNGGVVKPAPMMKIRISGTFKNLKVVNSPARTYSVSNPATLVMDTLTIDNSQGNAANAASNGLAAGHNTDGFDVSTTNLTIQNSVVSNQDDCLAINSGSNIVFTGNTCTGGHGISIGSVQSGATVSGITISNNKIINNGQALRIKTVATATSGSVSNVVYSGNVATGSTNYGVLIDQSYPATMGTPGTGISISGISFTGTANTIAVASTGVRVGLNCGVGKCTGTWDWSKLTVTGGKASKLVNPPTISGGTYL